MHTRIIRALAVSALALTSFGAQASNDAPSLSIIDMTTDTSVSADVVITTGFLTDLDVIAFDETPLPLASGDIAFDESASAFNSGWTGLVEIDMDEDAAIELSAISSFSDTFDTSERRKKMSGFYTMRYEFNTSLPFRPYAGAGLGLIATSDAAQTGGVFAGRATAGFDFTVAKDAAIFAEYAYVKSGGVNIGLAGDAAASDGAIADSEHSLKLGFRRTF